MQTAKVNVSSLENDEAHQRLLEAAETCRQHAIAEESARHRRETEARDRLERARLHAEEAHEQEGAHAEELRAAAGARLARTQRARKEAEARKAGVKRHDRVAALLRKKGFVSVDAPRMTWTSRKYASTTR